MKQKVTVLGAGVIGLTTAVLIQEAGHPVSIVSELLSPHTTSDKAGAIWFPVMAKPFERIAGWCENAYAVFQGLAHDISTGVSMVDFTLLGLSDEALNDTWKRAFPADSYRDASPTELPNGHSAGFVIHTPFIAPNMYLSYLMARFKAAGGKILVKKVTSFEDPIFANSTLINCTGLGARELAHDDKVRPVWGHTVRIPPLEQPLHIVNDAGPDNLAYIFSRKDDTLLGGTAVPALSNSIETEANRILQRTTQLYPALSQTKILGMECNPRPSRETIRLERDPETGILHNYGHGGAGFTLSWGCAAEVLSLLNP